MQRVAFLLSLKSDDPAKTILQPKNNLECGVKILENQVTDVPCGRGEDNHDVSS